MEDYTIKAATLKKIISRIGECLGSLERASDALQAGVPAPDGFMSASDVVVELSFSADDVDEVFGGETVSEKRDAIMAVSGAAHILQVFANSEAAETMSRAQAGQLAASLSKAAKIIDTHANRATLYGGAI